MSVHVINPKTLLHVLQRDAGLMVSYRCNWPETVEPARPEQIPARDPVQLRPIPWGQRDAATARAVCRHMAAVNAVVIPFNPLHHHRVCAWLRSHGIHH